jgi:hypothetical protein
MGFEEGLKLLCGKLRASVGMEDHRFWPPSLPHGHQDGLHDQVTSQLWLHRPPNHLSRKHIEDDRQIELAFLGGNIGDIGYPFGIRNRCGKVPGELIGDPSRSLSGFPPLPALGSGNSPQTLSPH